MTYKYQLVLVGPSDLYRKKTVDLFFKRIEDLGLSRDSVIIQDEQNFFNEFKPNCPAVCIYFGVVGAVKNLDVLNVLINESSVVIPVVSDLNHFSDYAPEQLKGINGMQVDSDLDLASLVSNVLEGFGLLRLSRRLFISYRRAESRGVAIQLYEYLDQCGFDVFLDTHSIRPSEDFQDELWHRLVDTDVVVLLDTPGFLTSNWTTQELAKALAMSIGVLRLVWPKHQSVPGSELCVPKMLQETDFENGAFDTNKAHLTESAILNIAVEVESLRARSLAARQDNLIKEFIVSAKGLSIRAQLQPERIISIQHNGKEMAVIPTVGVPHAFTYNQTEELVKRIRKNNSSAYLIYDQRNIREKWQEHLAWLDQYLPITTIQITEIEKWLMAL